MLPKIMMPANAGIIILGSNTTLPQQRPLPPTTSPTTFPNGYTGNLQLNSNSTIECGSLIGNRKIFLPHLLNFSPNVTIFIIEIE